MSCVFRGRMSGSWDHVTSRRASWDVVDTEFLGGLAVAKLDLLEQGRGSPPAVPLFGGVRGGLPELLVIGVLSTSKQAINPQ